MSEGHMSLFCPAIFLGPFCPWGTLSGGRFVQGALFSRLVQADSRSISTQLLVHKYYGLLCY